MEGLGAIGRGCDAARSWFASRAHHRRLKRATCRKRHLLEETKRIEESNGAQLGEECRADWVKRSFKNERPRG